jgi:hypothetical protein
VVLVNRRSIICGFESRPLAKELLLIVKLSCAISRAKSTSDFSDAVDLGSPVLNPDPWFLLRKEVIQPQVPLRLPCYDFIPITIHTFGTYFLAVSTVTSGTNGFHDVTGGVYKAWERIHGAVADAPLLAIPTSCRRVADDNLNWARFLGICSTLRSCFPLCRAL